MKLELKLTDKEENNKIIVKADVVTLDDMIENFERLLKASGFHFNGLKSDKKNIDEGANILLDLLVKIESFEQYILFRNSNIHKRILEWSKDYDSFD